MTGYFFERRGNAGCNANREALLRKNWRKRKPDTRLIINEQNSSAGTAFTDFGFDSRHIGISHRSRSQHVVLTFASHGSTLLERLLSRPPKPPTESSAQYQA